MPVYRITTPAGKFKVQSDRELTDEEAIAAIEGQVPEEKGLLERAKAYIPGAVRAAGGTVAGVVGAVPSPITTPAAAAIGGLTELGAQAVEQAQGTREDFNFGTAAVEAGLSAVPLGRFAKVGEGLGKAALRGAAKLGALEAVGTQARSLTETGELASVGETLTAGALGAAGGAVGGVAEAALGRRAAKAASKLDDAIKPVEEAVQAVDPELSKVRQKQLALFDDEGKVRPEVIGPMQPVLETGASARASGELIDAVKAEGTEAAQLLAKTEAAEGGQKLYRQVAELFEKGDIDAEGVVRELADNGLSMPEFIKEHYIPAVQKGARQLQQLSSLRQQISRLKDPEAVKALNQLGARTSFDKAIGFLQKLDDTRRSLMIGQVVTGIRNFVTQKGRFGVDVLDQALEGVFGGKGDPFGHIESLARAFKDKELPGHIDSLLKGRRDLGEKLGGFEWRPDGTFLEAPIVRATLGKYVEATTWINRWQEMLFRRAKFDAVVRQGLEEAGIDFSAAVANPRLVPEGLLDKGVNAALDVTFASPGGSKGAEKFVEGMQLLRPISTIFIPYPRYLANATRFVATHNPLGILRLATASGRANAPKVAAESLGSGSLLLGGALALRYSEAAGEKWYEVKYGDKRVDLRGFAGPFGPFLFAAEAIKQTSENGKTNFDNQDWVEGVLSVSRLAGSFRSILDWLNADDGQTGASAIAGQYISGFTVPFRTIKDAVSQVSDEEATYKDVREAPLAGPSLQNIPGASRGLPPAINATTGEPMKTEQPLLRQLTGLQIQTRNPVEAAMNELNLKRADLVKGTGIPKADRELSRRIGKLASVYGKAVVESEAYQAASPAVKTIALKNLYKSLAKKAREHLKETNPKIAAVLKAKKKLTKDQRALLAERGIDADAIEQRMIDEAPETP